MKLAITGSPAAAAPHLLSGTLIATFVFLACTATAWAVQWDYVSCRHFIEQQCPTNTVPAQERLFVGRMAQPTHASIVRFRRSIGLRELIDQSPFKGKVVKVCVMRLDHLKSGPFTRRAFIRVEPSERPDYKLEKLDVIWLYDDGPILYR